MDEMTVEDLRDLRELLVLNAMLSGTEEFTDFEMSVMKCLMGGICRVQFDRTVLAALNASQLAEFNAAANKANLLNQWYEDNKANAEIWLEQILDEDSDDSDDNEDSE